MNTKKIHYVDSMIQEERAEQLELQKTSVTTTTLCAHNYVYSHQETRLQYTGTNFKLVDVVICTKCGQVNRN